jgi:hypothetical protein
MSWFVVNVRDTEWLTSEGGELQSSGAECTFEPANAEFEQLGIRIHVLPPGEPNGCYHAESKQEDFLVLSGECTLLVIFMVGARGEDWHVRFPVSEPAARYGASVEREATSPHEAYAGRFEPSRRERPSFWGRLPWAS